MSGRCSRRSSAYRVSNSSIGRPRACARFNRGWCTEVPTLFGRSCGRSGITGQRHDVGLHRGPHASGFSLARNLRRRSLVPPQCLAQALDGERIARRSTVAEQVGHRLRNAEHRLGRLSRCMECSSDGQRSMCSHTRGLFVAAHTFATGARCTLAGRRLNRVVHRAPAGGSVPEQTGDQRRPTSLLSWERCDSPPTPRVTRGSFPGSLPMPATSPAAPSGTDAGCRPPAPDSPARARDNAR